MASLTKRQSEILKFIQQGIVQNGYPPTIREIASRFRLNSTRTVYDHVAALEKKGYLRRDRGKGRGLKLLRKPELSLSGEISAGSPMVPVALDDTVSLEILLNKDHVFLKVRGNSMIEDGIFEGDIIAVKPQSSARSGEIVACLIEGEVLVKRFSKKQGEIILMPANREMEPLVVKEGEGRKVELIGKIVGLFRKYR